MINSQCVYEKVDKRGKEPLEAQKYFCDEAIKNARKPLITEKRVFEPHEHI